jgi:hypothetical protein
MQPDDRVMQEPRRSVTDAPHHLAAAGLPMAVAANALQCGAGIAGVQRCKQPVPIRQIAS